MQKDTDKLAANSNNPHEYDDNQRHLDYLYAIGEYCPIHELFLDGSGECPECNEMLYREGEYIEDESE